MLLKEIEKENNKRQNQIAAITDCRCDINMRDQYVIKVCDDRRYTARRRGPRYPDPWSYFSPLGNAVCCLTVDMHDDCN